MRLIVVLVAVPVVIALATSTSWSAGSSSNTSVTISFWEKGISASDKETWTLRCNPAAGTLPRPGAACQRIASGGKKLFAPVPEGSLCTQIYGGPQVARVVGTVAGSRVWVKVTRTDGCQISRWDRLSPWLLPGGATR